MAYQTILQVSVVLFAVALIVLNFLSKSPLRHYFIDTPDSRKIHQIQIPRIGGFGMIFSFFIVVIPLIILKKEIGLYYIQTNFGLAVLTGIIIVFIVGFFDDLASVTIGTKTKFAAQFLFALITVYYFKIYVADIRFFGSIIHLGFIGPLLSVFWIVGVMNAFNIIDGIDGLSTSVTLVTLIFVSLIVFIIGEDYRIFNMTFPLIALLLAFLVLNYPPAKIFAGDTGSLFYGVIASLLSVKLASHSRDFGTESLVAFFVVAIPVMEVFVSMLRRFYYGVNENKNFVDSLKRMVEPDNLHMHHRLIFKGYTHEQALRFLLFFAVSVASLSLVLVMTSNLILQLLTVLYGLYFVYRVFRKLDYAKAIFTSVENNNIQVRKTVLLCSKSENFINALTHYANGSSYFIKSCDTIETTSLGIADTVIIDSSSALAEYKKIDSNLQIPIFIVVHGHENEPVFAKVREDNRIYILQEPVDVPYLFHDIELILKSSIGTPPQNTLSISGEENVA